MLDALRVVRYSLADFWEELVLFIGLNVLWSLAAVLPAVPWLLFAGSATPWFLALSGLLALPLPIVSAGLCSVANQATRAKAVSAQTFVMGMRRYWPKALGVAAANVVVLLLIASNVTVADAEGFRDSLEELWALRDAQAMLREDAANGD